VCMSVREDISGTTRTIFTILVHVAYGRGSVLFRRRYDTLCTSGLFMTLCFLSIMGSIMKQLRRTDFA